jgi:hypothetical protein
VSLFKAQMSLVASVGTTLIPAAIADSAPCQCTLPTTNITNAQHSALESVAAYLTSCNRTEEQVDAYICSTATGGCHGVVTRPPVRPHRDSGANTNRQAVIRQTRDSSHKSQQLLTTWRRMQVAKQALQVVHGSSYSKPYRRLLPGPGTP